MDLEVQAEVTDTSLRLEPVFKLFGRVGGAIVQNEDHVLDAAPEGFRNDHLLDKGLEIDKTFALSAGSVDLAIGNGQPGKQVACAATMITRFVERRFRRDRWAGWLLALACLNGGFFIDTHQPDAILQERLRLQIGIEDGTRSLQEG